MRAGTLRDLIIIERPTISADDYGGEVKTWAVYCQRAAAVIYGRADERRAAAQESASLAATFRIRSDPATDKIAVTDRLVFGGSIWDISSNVPLGRDGRDITAIRAV
jgi:head-tail adaptor